MQLCDYGCGREAKYYFKYAKKWCCEKYTSMCPELRKINSNSHKNISIRIQNTEGRLCEYGCNRVAKYQLVGNKKLCCSKTPASCEKMRKVNWYTHRTTILKIKEKFPFFYLIEKPRENKEGEIEVRCKWCNKWFVPKVEKLRSRINHLENDDGNDGCYLYCSESCQNKCPSYNIKYINQATNVNFYNSSEYGIWRNKVLRRQKEELGYNECEYCGNRNVHELSVHHEKPQITHPQFILDPDNGIIVCNQFSKNKCHSRIHVGECSSNSLNKKKCIQKNIEGDKQCRQTSKNKNTLKD